MKLSRSSQFQNSAFEPHLQAAPNYGLIPPWVVIAIACWAATMQLAIASADSTNRGTMAPVWTNIAALEPSWHVGVWIWETNAFAKQSCRLWRDFEVPPGAIVACARFRITADNGFRLLLNGREIGRGSDWRSMTEYDFTWLLLPGRHVIAVEGFNDRLEGGILAGLKIELMDGNTIEVPTDSRWLLVPEDDEGWEKRRRPQASWQPAAVVGIFGTGPWTTKPLAVTQVPPLRPVELHFWQTGWFQVVLLSVYGVAVLICLRLMARLALQSKAEGMLHRERARIARDIHDELGAGLTQLLLLGEVAQKDVSRDPERRPQIERLCAKARGLSVALDEVVWAVNSRRDTLRDFVSHTCKYAQSFLAGTPIRCRLDIESDLPPEIFDLPVRRNLFLATKEALTNAAKYSGTCKIHLRIRRPECAVEVVVEDFGAGFNPTRVDCNRNGLENMQQRMDEIGGSCEITSRPGQGCRVALRAPLKHSAQSHGMRWIGRILRGNAASKPPHDAPSKEWLDPTTRGEAR